MPDNAQLLSTGPRSPKRPRPLSRRVKDMIRLMVRGDDETGEPMDFIAAARLAGVGPDTARKWLHRGEVLAALRRERKAFRHEIAASNEHTLKDLRDNAANGMVRLKAVELIEEMNAADAGRAPGEPSPQHFSVNIIKRLEPPSPVTIEGRATPTDRFIAKPGVRVPYATGQLEAESEPSADPIFRPFGR